MILLTPFAALGRSTLALLASIGRVAIYCAQVISHILRPPWYPREFAMQVLQIGWLSLPVVGLTALFTGGALALQIHAGGSRFNAETVVPSIVAIGIARELGPVLGGLMVAGRVAAAIAAEIGTMKVTEQIDALVTLSTSPMKYLTVPRVLAATLTLPIEPPSDTDPQGVVFDLVYFPGEGALTGHRDGVITIDLAEADDRHRDEMRHRLDDP